MFLHFPPTEEAIETMHLNIKMRAENLQDSLGNQHEPIGGPRASYHSGDL